MKYNNLTVADVNKQDDDPIRTLSVVAEDVLENDCSFSFKGGVLKNRLAQNLKTKHAQVV